jgi:hypothetical protein
MELTLLGSDLNGLNEEYLKTGCFDCGTPLSKDKVVWGLHIDEEECGALKRTFHGVVSDICTLFFCEKCGKAHEKDAVSYVYSLCRRKRRGPVS